MPRLLWRDLFDAQRVANHAANGRYLLKLAQRLRSGQDIFCSLVSVLAQGANRNCCNITLINRCGRSGQIWPSYDIAHANLQAPPTQSVGREHSRPKKRPLDTRGLNQPLDLPEQHSKPIRLLKKRMCSFYGSREKHDAPCMFHNPLQSRSNGGRRGGPHKEHSIDTIKAWIKCFRESEIAANYFELWRHTSCARIAHHRADLRVPCHQLRENPAADGAGPSNNQNTI